MQPLSVGIHFGIPDSVYRADPGYNQSTLVDFMEASTPAHFKSKQAKAKEELADKDFIRIGSYVDCALTEPGEVNNRFVITPAVYPCKPTNKDPRTAKPWSRNATYCKEWEAEQKEAGKVCLSPPEYARALGTLKALQANEDAAAALEFCHKQVVVIAEHPTYGYRMKGKLDLLPPPRDLKGSPGIPYIIDIKTGESAAEDEMRRQCIRLWRHFQARYYLNLLHWSSNDYLHVTGFALFVAETDEPHGVQVHEFKLGYPELDIQHTIDGVLQRYHQCITTGVWPCYSTDWKRIIYPEYMTRHR